jgi:hypothetical protein
MLFTMAQFENTPRIARSGARHRGLNASANGAVIEVNHAAAEAPLVQQFKPQPEIVGKVLFAAAHDDRRDEHAAFVDQPRVKRAGGKLGTGHT